MSNSSVPPLSTRALTVNFAAPIRTARSASILVTGATGFVGSRLCEVLHLNTDYRARAFVRSSGTAAYIAKYPLDLALGDLTDLASVRRAMEGCTAVVHLARGSEQVMRTGLKNVLRAAVEAKVERFVHVSSVAVYGDNPPPAAAFETAPASKTGNPYGDIKLEQEEFVTSYGRRFGLPIVILRPPHILGPYSHFMDALTQRLKAGLLPLVDGGEQICNLVYVDNLIQAILLALVRPEAVGETFFITDKEKVTWKICLDGFGAMLGVDVPRATVSQLARPSRPGTRDALAGLSSILKSSEFRSALSALPATRMVSHVLHRGYAALPDQAKYAVRRRLATFVARADSRRRSGHL